MAGCQQITPVQGVTEVDEAVVRDGADPFQRSLAPRGVEEHPGMVKTALGGYQVCLL